MPFLERTLPLDPAQGSMRAVGASRPGVPDPQAPEDAPPAGPVRTQMVGESPDDDLGYDPRLIPTEPIPDDE